MEMKTGQAGREIPKRVTLQENGAYRWAALTDREFKDECDRLGLKICIGISAAFFLAGIVLSVIYRKGTIALIAAGFALLILLMSYGVCSGQRNMPAKIYQSYSMYDEGVFSRQRRSGALIHFKDIKAMTVNRDKNYLSLKKKTLSYRVYVPAEDMDFVVNYIAERMPADAELLYE